MSESNDKAKDDEVELKVSEAIVRERVEGFGKVGLLWRFEAVFGFFFFFFNFWVCVLGSGIVFLLFLFKTHLDLNSYDF